MASSFLDLFRLDDQVALITGAGGGIGRAVARCYAEVGATVVVTDANPTALDEVVAEIEQDGGRALPILADITDQASVTNLIGTIAAQHGRLDILVNCAGISLRRSAVDFTPDEWNRVMQVNLNGTFFCAQAAGRLMIDQPTGGRIINVASVAAFYGGGLFPNAAYKASKAAVLNLTRALAVEWAPHSVRVNSVAPSFTRTSMGAAFFDDPERSAGARAVTPLPRLGEVEDLMGAFLYFASRASDWVTGQSIVVDGGLLSR